jgi:uncharacterized protein (DUF488 family)
MPLFSVGHSNHPLETFLAILADAGIEVLADVRSRPASRFCPQFNRKALAASLAAAGIEYRFEGAALGGKDPLPATDPAFVAALTALVDLSRTRAVALMCSEREPERCHRSTTLAAWIRRHRPDTAVVHLVPRANGSVERIG